MPSYKVVYFDGRGRAEPARMMLRYAGQKFEDVRYSPEEWAKHKPTTPFQQLPYLEVDGKIIPQSSAMQGFLARELGLNGANNEETTKIDLVGAVVADIVDPLTKILFYEKDEAKKKELSATYYGETAPRFLKGLEEILKTNNGGDGFFVGSKISRADIIFYVGMEAFRNDDVLKQYPKLYSLKERIAQDPKIAAYLKDRPQTQF
ncbi:S-crystallin SL11-like isoform X2 [Acanthaster planci]|uniref:S-crystallin SL11-like isoform X2 n=1 Tax=Acanthaster planci TaxID=133434 RepID=A0A8B7XYZ6_ACAPL|nr:S-crystallin SL11-like isoform X2 [Acanthaster planci]